MAKFSWYLVTYPNGVQLCEWMTEKIADVKARATGKPVVQVWVYATHPSGMLTDLVEHGYSAKRQEAKVHD